MRVDRYCFVAFRRMNIGMTSNMSSLGLTSSNTRLVDLSYDVLSMVDYREY